MHTPSPRRRRLTALLILLALVILAGAGGAALGYFLQLDLPNVQALADYAPPLMTRVVAQDGSQVASFAEQRRILIEYRDIPKEFRQALVAVEDSSFERHAGIDFQGILRAAWHNLMQLRKAEGASTLTQQLARNLFLHAEKTVRRKLQEMVLAVEIERHYTKEEILRFYCNQVYMGHGRYGLEAASRFYFGKPARELDLPQAALLAGIIQRPESLSPLKNPERALARRDYVLRRMEDEGYLTPAQLASARQAPLGLHVRSEPTNLAPYFVEEVRRKLQERYGDTAIYQGGLEIRTTLDPRLQDLANRAMDGGLRELDRRQGWRGVAGRVPALEDPVMWEAPSWKDGIRPGVVTDGVVVAVTGARARVKVGPYQGDLGKEQVAWTGRRAPSSFLKRGDLVRVRVTDLDLAGGEASLTLEQEPLAEAALVAIEPSTGAVRALVGGFDFGRSQFDRAMQARRQTGSAFKPFVYAAALAAGRTASDRILDEPTVFFDPTTSNPYQPENYGFHYYGALTLREALEKSANIATVRLLTELGYESVIRMARRLGIESELRPYPSMALGAFEVTLLELTSAYGTFANQGVRVAPHLVSEVLGSDGTVLERVEPEVQEAVSPQIAYLMTRLLEGVITDGTGAAAASLGRPLAGKTGTTDDFTDAWFLGYAPDLVVGVWVGFDVKKSLGSRETGALAALPIWQAFMEPAYEGRPPEDFPMPAGISVTTVDRATGLRANPAAGCRPTYSEAFLSGAEPTVYCSVPEHVRLMFPYPFHRYPINEQGELTVPGAELEDLLVSEPSVRLIDDGERLEALTPSGAVSLAVRRVEEEAAPAEEPVSTTALEEKIGSTAWVGHDGRKARVVVLK